jgi:hypothetical protein
MKSLLIRVILQFAYVNSVMLVGIQIYSMLPRILNVLLVFLVIPIFLIFVCKYLGLFMFKILKADLENDDVLVVPLGISAATLWLALTSSLFDFSGGNYVQLIQHQAFENVPVKDAHKYSHAGYIRFSDGRVALDYYGVSHHTSTRKSGDVRSRIRHSYYTYPVVSEDWTPDQPIHAWLCESTSNSESTSLKDEEHPRLPGLMIRDVKGMLVRNPYDVNYYSQAIENAIKQHGVKAHPKGLLIAYQERSYDRLLDVQRFRFMIFMGMVNMLWVGVPGLLMFRNFWARKKPGKRKKNSKSTRKRRKRNR